MGIIQRAMVRSCPHVWFERAEMKDRHLVTKRWVLPLFLSSSSLCGFLGLLSSEDVLVFSWQLFVWLFFLLFFNHDLKEFEKFKNNSALCFDKKRKTLWKDKMLSANKGL